MSRHLFASIGFALLSSVLAAPAALAAQRTFVASTGNDLNPCSITQPCRGFTRAISQTTAGGEVIVQDSAGYGAVTIQKSVSIIAPPGVYAGISVTTGIGVTVEVTFSDTVTLKGLTIVGLGGATGIALMTDGTLNVIDCTVRDFTQDGIALTPNIDANVLIAGTTVSNNAHDGIVVNPSGASGTTHVTLDRVTATGNGLGANGYGVRFSAPNMSSLFATINSSLIEHNETGVRILGTTPTVASLFIVDTSIVNNGASIIVGANTGAILEKTSVRSLVGGIVNGGTIGSFGNNAILDGLVGNPIALIPPQ